MATEGGSLASLVQVYKFVVEDVIKNVKEEFLNEGVEPEVLDQLQELWLRKEDLTDAVNRPRKPQFDPVPNPPPPPPPPPPAAVAPTNPSPRLPPALIHQPLPPPPTLPSTIPHRSAGTQSTQESVIQQAPPRETQTTPTQPSVAALASPSTSFPSPQQQLQLLTQAGFQVAMPTQVGRGVAAEVSKTTPTSSQGIQTGGITLPQVGGATGGAVSGATGGIPPGLMHQLVVNPAALQNQPVLLPMQTSQGNIFVPLASVLAMQQAVAAQAVSGGNEATPTTNEPSTTVHQIDGLPPSPPPLPLSSPSGCGLKSRVPETPPTTNEGMKPSSSGIPPEVLRQLLRQQRRRRRQGKRGGIPVEFIVQLDGPGGGGGGGGKGGKGKTLEGEGSSSEDDSDGYGDSSDEEEVEQVDEDPLGSDDDEPDSADEEKDFDTEDTIACQWEKVYRVKTKWKFQMKDGIMRMAGFEYVFHKANGEAEW